MPANKSQLLQSLLNQLEQHPDDRLVESLQNSLLETQANREKRTALIDSAVSLEPSQAARLTSIVKRQFPQVEDIIFRVSPDLLAGLKIRVGDELIDDSAQTALDLMKKTLL